MRARWQLHRHLPLFLCVEFWNHDRVIATAARNMAGEIKPRVRHWLPDVNPASIPPLPDTAGVMLEASKHLRT